MDSTVVTSSAVTVTLWVFTSSLNTGDAFVSFRVYFPQRTVKVLDFPSLPVFSGESTEILPNLLGMLYANGLWGWMRWNRPLWFLPCGLVTFVIVYFLEDIIERLTANKCKRSKYIYISNGFCCYFVRTQSFILEIFEMVEVAVQCGSCYFNEWFYGFGYYFWRNSGIDEKIS